MRFRVLFSLNGVVLFMVYSTLQFFERGLNFLWNIYDC